MSVMNVKKMTIDNFKGIEHLEVPFGEKGVLISGDNETGKSTVYDAFCYCLTGKNSEGETQFEVVPIGKEGLSPSVEIEYEIDGTPCTIKRVYACKKDRTGKISGYSTKCFVNGIERGVKEFDSFIESSVAPSDVLRLMVDTRYFTEHMPSSGGLTRAQRQREMLFGMVEMDADEKILESEAGEEPGFSDLKELLVRFKTISEISKFCKARVSEVQKKMVGIPEAIEKYSGWLESDEGLLSESELNCKIQIAEEEIQEAKEARKQADHEYLVKVKEKMDASTRRSEEAKQKIEDWRAAEQARRMRKAYDALRKCEEKERAVNAQLTKTTIELSEKKDAIKREIRTLESEKKGLSERIDSLSREYRRLKQESEKAESICPTCGQPLPNAMVLKLKGERDERLKEIAEQGKQAKKNAAEVDNQIKSLKERIEAISFPEDVSQAVLDAKEEVEKARTLYDKAVSEKVYDDEAPENIKAEFESAVKEACSILSGNDEADELYKKKSDAEKDQEHLELQLVQLKKNLEKVQRNNDTKSFIKELEDEAEKLNKELDDCQRIQDLCQKFEDVRSEILEQKANEKFEKVRWKLFEKQKNGKIVPCCIATFNGKDYDCLSASTKTICNLDIVQSFQRYYGCKLPVFVDNAEGITGTMDYDGQFVGLFVEVEACPECGNITGRKQTDGLWKCKNCGKEFKKQLEIYIRK